jgi:hypothetical protein
VRVKHVIRTAVAEVSFVARAVSDAGAIDHDAIRSFSVPRS